MGILFVIIAVIIIVTIIYVSDFQNRTPDTHNHQNQTNDDYGDANIELYNCAFKEETLVRLKERYMAIDFETTGLNPKTDRIIEIGAVLFVNGKPADTFSTLVNPGISIPARATEINHISNAMVMSAPSESVAFSQFVDFLGNALNSKTILCAHNSDFDMHFLGETLIRLGYSGSIDSVDTLAVSRKMVSGVENYKLTTLIKHYGIETGQAHRANSDALACGKLLAIFLEKKKGEIVECEKKQEALEQKRKEYLENRKMIEISPKNDRKSINSIPVINIFDSAYDMGYALFKEAEEIRKGKTDYLKAIELYDKSRETGFCTVGLYESYAMTYRKLKDYDNEIAILDEGLTRLKDRNENYTSLEERRNKAVCLKLNHIEKENEKKKKEQEKQLKLQAKAESEKEIKLPQGKRVVQMNGNMEIIKTYNSIAEAARTVGVDPKGIRSVVSGKQKSSGGYLWKLEEN
ncbi:MAG: exonuclease domain-containing protein [Oscillospiraceae bacterium]